MSPRPAAITALTTACIHQNGAAPAIQEVSLLLCSTSLAAMAVPVATIGTSYRNLGSSFSISPSKISSTESCQTPYTCTGSVVTPCHTISIGHTNGMHAYRRHIEGGHEAHAQEPMHPTLTQHKSSLYLLK